MRVKKKAVKLYSNNKMKIFSPGAGSQNRNFKKFKSYQLFRLNTVQTLIVLINDHILF